MQIGGIAVWVLLGMFGFGTGLGLAISLFAARRLYKPPVPGDWWGPCFGLLFSLALIAASMLIAGFAAVALSFAAHHAGWDTLLTFLASIGIAFFMFVTGWLLWLRLKK